MEFHPLYRFNTYKSDIDGMSKYILFKWVVYLSILIMNDISPCLTINNHM
ncbi:hypothetical protein XBJ1_0657 [Xenorhabdus bovienii SS-2004]|uniref:Uncharacterized protein n=1 Tax=Xenorhabdus bovienii (strain SS-2004) TaxID=406818 RepID=D3UZF5_XENBS|nr:hypothetical protein XBJ1_0657 [Xenorhabdus bovienii SS-2004]